MLIKLKIFTFLFLIFIYNNAIAGYSFKYSDDGKLFVSVCKEDDCSPYGKVSGEEFRKIYESNTGRNATIKYLGENKAYLIYNASVDTYKTITKDYIDSVEYANNIANGLMLINNRVHSAPMCRDRALALADNTKEFSTPAHIQCHPDLNKINDKDFNVECSYTAIVFKNQYNKNQSCKDQDKLKYLSKEFCNSKELSTSANKIDKGFEVISFFDKNYEIKNKFGKSAQVTAVCISTANRDRIKVCKEKDVPTNLESTCPLNPCNSIWNHIMTGVFQKDKNGGYSDDAIVKLARDRYEELEKTNKFPRSLLKSLHPDAQGRGQNIVLPDVGMTYAKEKDEDGIVKYKVHPELYEDAETIKKLKIKDKIKKDREGFIKNLMSKQNITRDQAEEKTNELYNEYIPLRLRKADFRDFTANNETEEVEQKGGAEDRGEGLMGHGTRMAANMVSARVKPDEIAGAQTTVGYAEKASVIMYKTHTHPAIIDIFDSELKGVNRGLKKTLENNRNLQANVNKSVKKNFGIELGDHCGENHLKGLGDWGCLRDVLSHLGCSSDDIGAFVANRLNKEIAISDVVDKNKKCQEAVSLNNKYYKDKADIVSMSFGTDDFVAGDDDYNEMRRLLKELRKDGVVLVAAAGNDADVPIINSIQRGLFKRSSPCIFEDVICVTGNSAYMTPWRGGYSYFAGEIALPADALLTSATGKSGDYTNFDVHFSYGTSYATSGFAALVSRVLSSNGSYVLDTMYPKGYGVSLIRAVLAKAKKNDQKGCNKFTLNTKSSDKSVCTFTPVTCKIPDAENLCGPKVDVDTLSERLCKGRRGEGFGHGILTNFQKLITNDLPSVNDVKDKNLELVVKNNIRENFDGARDVVNRATIKKNLTTDHLKKLAMLGDNSKLAENIGNDNNALALYELTSNERKSYFNMGRYEREIFLNLSLEHKVAYTAMDEREKNRVLNMYEGERNAYLDEDKGTRQYAMGMDWNEARRFIQTPKAQRGSIFPDYGPFIAIEKPKDIDDPTAIVAPTGPRIDIKDKKDKKEITEPSKFKDEQVKDDKINESDFNTLEKTATMAKDAIDEKEGQDREDKRIAKEIKIYNENVDEFLISVGDKNKKYKDILLTILEIYPDLKQYVNYPNSNRPCPYNLQIKFKKLISSQE